MCESQNHLPNSSNGKLKTIGAAAKCPKLLGISKTTQHASLQHDGIQIMTKQSQLQPAVYKADSQKKETSTHKHFILLSGTSFICYCTTADTAAKPCRLCCTERETHPAPAYKTKRHRVLLRAGEGINKAGGTIQPPHEEERTSNSSTNAAANIAASLNCVVSCKHLMHRHMRILFGKPTSSANPLVES
jgi:hypothetical protein